jgi:hypothetical protein
MLELHSKILKRNPYKSKENMFAVHWFPEKTGLTHQRIQKLPLSANKK